jgi:hypothetical protein
MTDDISKLPISPASKQLARKKGLKAMTNTRTYDRMTSQVLNQPMRGFKDKDASVQIRAEALANKALKEAKIEGGVKATREQRLKWSIPDAKPHEIVMYNQLRDGGDSHSEAIVTIEGERLMANHVRSYRK